MNKKQRQFVETVWEYYRREGRHDLPWRKTKDPYRILVSEVMLQQTQVDRVIQKYREFLRCFPSLASLARAPLGDVLRVWQGLGYNRRAKMLHECAKVIATQFRGLTPKSHAELMKLPGIGHYTAGAVMAFAFNEPVPIVETNIRSAVIHYFFHDDTDVHDADIVVIVEKTLDHENPREWYWALMDHGAYIKKEFGNPNSRSKHYTRQSPFKGSDRAIRGAIIRLLIEGKTTRAQFLKKLDFEDLRIDAQLARLEDERMVVRTGKTYSL